MTLTWYGVQLDVMARCARCGVFEDVKGWPPDPRMSMLTLVEPLPAPGDGWGIVPLGGGGRGWGCAKCAAAWRRASDDAERYFLAEDRPVDLQTGPRESARDPQR